MTYWGWYQVSQKKWMIAKSYFWGPLETVFSLLWYLEHLFRILGLVHVLKERFLCPYNVPYSPYKPYQSQLGLSFWLWLWLKLSLEGKTTDDEQQPGCTAVTSLETDSVAWTLVNDFLCHQSWSYDDAFCRE